MTANPDSALREALEKTRDALAPLTAFDALDGADADTFYGRLSRGEVRRAREAHALIIEALAQSQDKP